MFLPAALHLDLAGNPTRFPPDVASRPADSHELTLQPDLQSMMWNDIPSAEQKQLMEEIDATELQPDEAELERWLENQLS